jgi:hypothetical protein
VREARVSEVLDLIDSNEFIHHAEEAPYSLLASHSYARAIPPHRLFSTADGVALLVSSDPKCEGSLEKVRNSLRDLLALLFTYFGASSKETSAG